jgi:magnesium-transporting ATPase (P-type)
MMNAKPAEKSKRLVNADLNFISQKPLEMIVQELQALQRDTVTTQVEWTETDTALFQLTTTRDGRTTAEVSGRLQRWAGDMTHIYCDGRTFYKKMSYVSSFVRWVVVFACAAPFFTCPLALFSDNEILSNLFLYSIMTLAIVSIPLGIVSFVSHLMYITRIQRRTLGQSGLSKPEKKDHERLLQYLTEIIRDEELEQSLVAQAPTPQR